MIAPALVPESSVSLFAVLSLGFFLGMRHATDPDHVVAVSTIISRERKLSSAALIGALWGAGHTLTIVVVGVAILFFTMVIPTRVGLSMEFSVGLMLILLGALNVRSVAVHGARRPPEHSDDKSLAHPGAATAGRHRHEAGDLGPLDRSLGGFPAYQWVRPLLIGLVHGLAGSAAVALLVLTTLHNSRWAVAYLFLFGVGTIAGMMLITVSMASALRYAGSRWTWLNRRLALATGVLSVAFGAFIVYQMGVVHGLFTTHPTWTPQ